MGPSTTDRDSLKSWYRQAMKGRVDELRGHRQGLAAADPATCDAARAVGQALRGSGATFGFPELTDVATLVEDAGDRGLLRRVEGLISHLHSLVEQQGATGRCFAEWLPLAAGGRHETVEGFPDLRSAWADTMRVSGLDARQLSERVAGYFGLQAADLGSPSRSALRLIPEALMRSGFVLPVGEDAEVIRVASADPTSLSIELDLMRMTGRTPVFTVASPDEIEHALSAVLDDTADVDRPRRAVLEPDGGTGKVLIADDDASSRLLARTVLEKQGYEVVEAGDGEEAMERLRTEQPVAVVVADLNMPRLDGLELIWEMRSVDEWSHIPVIVVTGETDEVLETKLIEEGADDYIRKPLDPRLFTARVGATFRRGEE